MSPLQRTTAVAVSPLLPQVIGSVFNIWYNNSIIHPLFTEPQYARFWQIVLLFNIVVYPIAIVAWLRLFRQIPETIRQLHSDESIPNQKKLQDIQRCAINLPWAFLRIALVAWLACIPVFLIALSLTSDPLDPWVYLHLPISFCIGGFMGASQGFFAVELANQIVLIPVLFRDTSPTDVPGIRPRAFRDRSVLLAISAIVCPLGSVMLLSLLPEATRRNPALILYVGVVGILFGMIAAVLFGQSIARPMRHLRDAAHSIRGGDLNTHINLIRADEFGTMINEFNRMAVGLSEKQQLTETFGRHVGRAAAQEILARDGELGGVERRLTVLFADIRGFTTRADSQTAPDVVRLLNAFFTEMVQVIEEHGGMVNKFLGDGLMALFGADGKSPDHARQAVLAAQEMLQRVSGLNQSVLVHDPEPLEIGIGIHTGMAVIGRIGSPQRLDYTAMATPSMSPRAFKT